MTKFLTKYALFQGHFGDIWDIWEKTGRPKDQIVAPIPKKILPLQNKVKKQSTDS